MSRNLRGSLGVAVLVVLMTASSTDATPKAEETTELEGVAIQLLEAEAACIAPTRFYTLKNRVERHLEEWGRLELVMFPDEADVLIALEATQDYAVVPTRKDCPEDEPESLCGRGVGTEPVFDSFRLRVFLSGEEDNLWSDEVAMEDEAEAAAILVERLRRDIETAQGGSRPEAP